jgi:hypothetical protein
MSMFMRYFWLVTLVFFVGGCSSYKLVTFPRIEDESGKAVGWDFSLNEGDKVKITLIDNSKVQGRIMAISHEALTLEPKHYTKYTKYNENLTGDYLPRVVLADKIQAVEKQSASGTKTALLATGIILGGFGLLLGAFAAGGGTGM